MNLKRTALLALPFLMIVAMASQSYADISNAAVLFLRIAPGARAASMGESFVAIADDATATHYNPAGLGASPLSKNWIEAKVPAEYRPLKGLAAMKARGGSSYTSYDVWAITPKGLLRFDNRKWRAGDVIETATDDNLPKLVGRYYGLTDKDQLTKLSLKIAAANSPETFESVSALRDSILALAPKDYKNMSQLQTALDSLVQLYSQCRINWENVKELRSRYAEAKKDGAFNSTKMDRISFAVERTRNRFVPEQLTMPYGARMDGNLTAIASTGDAIVVGTTDGLFSYNGKVWRRFDTDGNLPSDSVLTLSSIGSSVFIGTDKGIARFNGTAVTPNADSASVPRGRVEAIGGDNSSNVWAAVDGDLYHFDGSSWSNRQRYTAVLEDSPEKIAAKFALYGTAAEEKLYLNKLRGGTDTGAYPAMTAGTVVAVPYLAEIKGRVNTIAVGMGKTVWLGTEYGIIYLDKDKWVMPGYREVTVDSAKAVADFVAQNKDLSEAQRVTYTQLLRTLNDVGGDTIAAGTKLKISKKPVPEVSQIARYGSTMMFATTDGLVEYDGTEFRRSDFRGVSNAPARNMSLVKEQLWVSGDDRIVTSSRGRSEVTVMYVKWLPELASDLYYSFLSFVKPTNNWGTFGGNITYLSYGTSVQTNEKGDVIGEFQSFDVAGTIAYGNSISNRLKVGMAAKVIYSKLSNQGAGSEQGKGTSTGFALDFGMLYQWTPRLNLGVALTNLGPKMAYIDANQADDLPRNLGVGIAYKVLQGTYTRLTYSLEANKLMVGLNQGVSEELKQVVINTGAEFSYANLISARAGYIYDQEGRIKVATIGVGLNPIDNLGFDVSWVPNGQNVALNNTLRYSLSFLF